MSVCINLNPFFDEVADESDEWNLLKIFNLENVL